MSIKHYSDLLRLFEMALPLLVVGRVGVRFEQHPLAFGGALAFYAAFYALLFEKGKQFDIVATPQVPNLLVFSFLFFFFTKKILQKCNRL